MKFTLIATSTALAATVALAANNNNEQPRGAHRNVARSSQHNALEKRSYSGQATYFVVGLGACGQYSQPGDFIVAMNTPQYGYGSPGPQCFKTITISNGQKSTQAKVMDECPTCDYGSLDMSAGLFQFFNPLSVGEFPITWSFGGGDAPAPPPKSTYVPPPPPKSTYVPPPPPKSTYVPPPPPKSTYVPPPPPPSSTYVWVPPTSSTKAWVPPTTSTKAWVPPTTSSVPPAPTTTSTTPTSSAAPAPSLAPGNIYDLYAVVAQLNNMVTGA